MEKVKKKIIIDTDIGDDFDDAFALALAMQMPEIDLLGVVTVFKDVTTRCKMARMMLDLGGHGSVPVCAGASHPLSQAEMFGKGIEFSAKLWSYIEECERYGGKFEDGHEFYVRQLEQSCEPVTIVTLGALTNIGRLLRERPDLQDRIEKLVVMGGAYDMNYSEYNFSCDPEAAQIVMESKVPKVLIGLDVTFRCFLDRNAQRDLKEQGHPVTDALFKMLRGYKDAVYLHDPLAVYAAAHEDYLKYRRDKIVIETTGKYTRGNVVKMCNCNWNARPEESNGVYAYEIGGRSFADVYMDHIRKYTHDAGLSLHCVGMAGVSGAGRRINEI